MYLWLVYYIYVCISLSFGKFQVMYLNSLFVRLIELNIIIALLSIHSKHCTVLKNLQQYFFKHFIIWKWKIYSTCNYNLPRDTLNTHKKKLTTFFEEIKFQEVTKTTIKQIQITIHCAPLERYYFSTFSGKISFQYSLRLKSYTKMLLNCFRHVRISLINPSKFYH